jgi:hypothetical protein
LLRIEEDGGSWLRRPTLYKGVVELHKKKKKKKKRAIFKPFLTFHKVRSTVSRN